MLKRLKQIARLKNRIPQSIALLCVFAVLSGLAGASHRRHQRTGNESGVFDYYLLNLSWSPEFCHSHEYSPECHSHYGFIVHGLWPQFTDGYPENCSNAPGLSDTSQVLPIMPDPSLIEHEWRTHGTCSGLSADDYFGLIRRAFSSVKIPARLKAPAEQFSMTPSDIKAAFVEANPGLNQSSIAVSCGNNYLTAIEICMSKELKPISCGEVRDCRANVVRITPVR